MVLRGSKYSKMLEPGIEFKNLVICGVDGWNFDRIEMNENIKIRYEDWE